MSSEKPADAGSDTTAAAKITPVYADERGFNEKDSGYPERDRVIVGGLDPNGRDGAVQRNLKGRHLAMVGGARQRRASAEY